MVTRPPAIPGAMDRPLASEATDAAPDGARHTAPTLGGRLFTPTAVGLGIAVAGAVAFSSRAIIVKLSYLHGVDATTVIMYRMLFALPLFLLMAWWAGRGKEPLGTRDRLTVFALGFLGYYLSSYLDFLGLQYISAGLDRLINYINPTVVLLLGAAVARRPVRPVQLAAMAVSYAGVLLVFAQEASLDGPNTRLGASLVFLSTITYAIYLVVSGQMVRRLGALRLVGQASTVACVLCVLQFLILKPLSAAQVPDEVITLAVINAVFGTALPVLLVMMAVERIGPTLTTQVGMIGPMATIAMGVVILGEPMNAWIFAGTVLVLGGVYMTTRTGGN